MNVREVSISVLWISVSSMYFLKQKMFQMLVIVDNDHYLLLFLFCTVRKCKYVSAHKYTQKIVSESLGNRNFQVVVNLFCY